MNTLNKTLITLATGAILATTANAGNHINTNSMTTDKTYVGLKSGQFIVDDKGTDKLDNATAYGLYVGHEFNNGLGLEADYIGSDDTSVTVDGVDGEYDIKQYGAYGTYRHHFANTGGLYGKAKLGVAKTEIDVSYEDGDKNKEDDTAVAGGLGLGYNIANNFTIEGEYNFNGSDIDANLWTVGLHYNF